MAKNVFASLTLGSLRLRIHHGGPLSTAPLTELDAKKVGDLRPMLDG